MAQWLEPSPPTLVSRVRFRPHVTCGTSLLLVLPLLRWFFSGYHPKKLHIGSTWKAAKADMASSLKLIYLFYVIYIINEEILHELSTRWLNFTFRFLGRWVSRARWLVFAWNQWSAPSDTLSTNQWTSRKTEARTVRRGEGVAPITITTHWGGVGWPWKRSILLANVRTGRWYWSIWHIRGLYGRRWVRLCYVIGNGIPV